MKNSANHIVIAGTADHLVIRDNETTDSFAKKISKYSLITNAV